MTTSTPCHFDRYYGVGVDGFPCARSATEQAQGRPVCWRCAAALKEAELKAVAVNEELYDDGPTSEITLPAGFWTAGMFS